MDYKQTVNLPQTDFPMKADLPKREPGILARWQEMDIYRLMQHQRQSAPRYILHDGPPYANGNIHIGHALNKILKDIVVKYKTMSGFAAPYVPGWDCHGLPVEHQLFKELGKRKDEVEQVAFREQAQQFALKFVALQRDEFKRLGVFGDWEHPYLTLSPAYEAGIIRAFGALVAGGYIYKGCKPVNWCVSCETALAEAEVEYEDHTSPSIYVKFPVPDAGSLIEPARAAGARVFLVIWTTTPWTLLGNVACAVHPDFTYVFVSHNGELLIMEEHLAARVMEQAGVKDFEIAGQMRGVRLEHLVYQHPWCERTGRVVLADYVSSEDGSGIVHTAPGYGAEDFHTGKRYGLDVLMQVDERGCFSADIPQFGARAVYKVNPEIIELLNTKGLLLASGQIFHSYPHCWRCKRPIIFRATDQWFMSVDHAGLRQKALQVVGQVQWIPAGGQQRISSMVENRPDWCLSRQRLWGVPVPVFYCQKCRAVVLDPAVIEQVAQLVALHGSTIWFGKSAGELMPAGYRCASCGTSAFEKERDILDVWFDSGVSHHAVLRARPELGYPADLYLEGSDQHRGWFQASLIAAMGINGTAPFRAVLTHGFTVDGEGKKMSKSRGNVIAPQQVIARLGADVLRLCIAASDYNDDVRMSEEILARVSESYRKIRNTLKYILGNLYDFDPARDAVAPEHLLEIDRWARSALHTLVRQVNTAYESFIFHQAVKHIYSFCVVELSSFYLDVLKDRLYTFSAASPERRSGQTVLYEIVHTLVRLIAPILPFTAEEAYGFLPGTRAESVFLTDWPVCDESAILPELQRIWQFLLAVRLGVLKELEESRSRKEIGNSLEACVEVRVSADAVHSSRTLQRYADQLPGVFIVSQVRVHAGIDTGDTPGYNVNFTAGDGTTENAVISARVSRAAGVKCVRCWNVTPTVGTDAQHPQICRRCVTHVTMSLKGDS